MGWGVDDAMRDRLITLATLMIALLWAAAALAGPRAALVIGNDAYVHLPALGNAARDARALDARLRELGFDSMLLVDVPGLELNRAIHEFAGKVQPGGVGLIFYAGHGIEANGRNYLIPVDSVLESDVDLRWSAIDLEAVLGRLKDARARLNVVVLDACRDNPLPTRGRSAARGLARVSAPSGTFIAYAAAPGEVALDGKPGGHGVFTGELLRVLAEPGLTLEEVFKRVASRVRERTAGRQEPWIQASVTGDFYFNAQTVAVREPLAPPQSPAGGFDPRVFELAFWQSIKDSTRDEDYEAYLRQYPAGIFAALARMRAMGLRESKPPPEAAPTEVSAETAAIEAPEARAVPPEAPRVEASPGAVPESQADLPMILPLETSVSSTRMATQPELPPPDIPDPAQLASEAPGEAGETEETGDTEEAGAAEKAVAAVVELDGNYVTLQPANLRAGPTTDSEKIRTLSAEILVRATGRLADGSWIRIEHAERSAWVWAQLLAPMNKSELAAWRSVKRSDEPTKIREFIRHYPRSRYVAAAKDRLASLAPRVQAVRSTLYTPPGLDAAQAALFLSRHRSAIEQAVQAHYLKNGHVWDERGVAQRAERIHRIRSVALDALDTRAMDIRVRYIWEGGSVLVDAEANFRLQIADDTLSVTRMWR